MAHEPFDARAVANAILAKATARGQSLTLMQLIKLVYLAHGWSLSILNRPLVKSEVQAWQYGPVYPEVYSAFKRFGSGAITLPAVSKSTGATYEASLDKDDEELLDAVLDAYGELHAFQLSNMLHRPGTPWTKVFYESGPYSVIPNPLIKEHYDGLNGPTTSN